MKRVLVESCMVLLLASAAVSPVHAQPPTVALYFDRALTWQIANCPDSPIGTELDTLYVAASGFSTPLEGIEYRIVFPPEIIWLGDLNTGTGLTLGDPVTGASIAFFAPQDASGPVIIQEMVVLWLCQGCAVTNIPITFDTHPATGFLRAVTSDLAFTDVVGLTSVVCATCVGCGPTAAATLPRVAWAGQAAEQCVLDCPAGDGGVILPGELPGQYRNPDLDHDGTVTILDYAEFGTTYLEGAFGDNLDFYCSGNLDLIDFVLFTRHWSHTATTPVESSTWGRVKAQFSN